MPAKIEQLNFNSKNTFLFDIGQVLLSFDFETSLTKLVPTEIRNPLACVHRVLERKDALEKGEINPVAFAQWALKILYSEATVEQFYLSWQQIFSPNEAMWDCVRSLAQKNHTLILISNINAIHCPWIFARYPEFALFRHQVLSFEIGMLKPNPAIYRYAIDTFRLKPENTIYVDDQYQNIAMGKSMGFLCWQYDSKQHLAFENWLKTILVSNCIS